ncbi:hypothetical protein CPB83DRAFT_444601 [Crepidotus variabilis]|uniref:Uncharacterized protein n=1 Tax=Crepidotus variabilis TaxID=179855 RepID=A0A9P6JNK1_9AGAR|nr:hypothetical protein CPB83DRAFT_444601 [Crepidotus variabilis]
MSSPTPQLKESRLPAELEREIFEIAAANQDIQTGLKLILTAKRVREWIEPTFYRVLIKCTDVPRTSPFLKHLHLENISPIERQKLSYCHCLLLQSISVEDAVNLLSACPNITDLAMWVLQGSYTPLGEILLSMKIQRLSVRINDVLRGFSSSHTLIGSPLSQALTHLDLIDLNSGFWDSAWKAFVALPRLTHLAVDGNNVVPTIEGMLNESKSIKLIVATSTTHAYLQGDLSNGESTSKWLGAWDVRFIHFPYPEGPISCWVEGTKGGEDLWVGAEKAQSNRIEQLKAKKESTKISLVEKKMPL